MFKGHKNLLLEFNKLIPSNFRIQVESRPHYQEAIDYMRRVKEETKNSPNVYTEFISLLKKYQDKSLTIEQVNLTVKQLMSDFPNLIENFKTFLPNTHEGSSSEEDDDFEPIPVKTAKKKPIGYNVSFEKMLVDVITDSSSKNEIPFFKRLKKVMDLNSQPGTDYFLELMKCFELYSDSVITKTELSTMVEPLFRLTNYFNFLNSSSSSSRRLPKEENREISSYIQSQLLEMFETLKLIASSRESSRRKFGWFFRPLSDFDTAKSKRHGHSYLEIQRPRIIRQLPNTEINGQWVSVPYGSEDVSSRNSRKNAFEDALFKCEDERFEQDMATESAAFTLRLLERAFDEANSLTPEQQKSFVLGENIFTKFRLKPIFNIYSEHSNKIVDMLRNNPIRALPVVISRIRTKIETWRKSSKFESERIWKETVERNFYKSLDHRSFYFKQNEKKMTNSKSFLSDAKARYLSREESKGMLRKYLKKELTQHSFEFLGGSRNTLFFNSFSGLSSGVIHRVHSNFKDDVIEEFQILDSIERKPLYLNSPEYSTLPHFRLLLTCESTLFDSIRIILFALEKTSQQERIKLDRWLGSIFKEFMQISLPPDITSYKFDDFFESTAETSKLSEENCKKGETKIETAKKIIDKWITSANYSDSDVVDSCFSENVQDPMSLKKDESFAGFLPLLKGNQLMYGPGSVYSFIRFFYDIYERLLKVKLILNQVGKEQESKKIEYGEYEFGKHIENDYLSFLKTVCQALRGNIDSGKFEEKCRTLLGNDSYVFFTFDKLVNYAAKALQALTSDDQANKAAVLHSRFSRSKLNEEMYLVESMALSPFSQIFRFHWKPEYKIISITYIESPYDKLSEQSVKNAQKYRKNFLSSASNLNVAEEVKSLISRVESYIKGSDAGLVDFAAGLFYYQNTTYGMVENSQKMFYVPEGEDFLVNCKFYSNNVILESEHENFICYDKNSAFEKISEISEKKFQTWRQDWLNSNV